MKPKKTKKGSMNVELKITGNYVKIYINGLIHIMLPYDGKFIVIQSFKRAKGFYCIQFITRKGNLIMECEYASGELWAEILKVWDENIA